MEERLKYYQSLIKQGVSPSEAENMTAQYFQGTQQEANKYGIDNIKKQYQPPVDNEFDFFNNSLVDVPGEGRQDFFPNSQEGVQNPPKGPDYTNRTSLGASFSNATEYSSQGQPMNNTGMQASQSNQTFNPSSPNPIQTHTNMFRDVNTTEPSPEGIDKDVFRYLGYKGMEIGANLAMTAGRKEYMPYTNYERPKLIQQDLDALLRPAQDAFRTTQLSNRNYSPNANNAIANNLNANYVNQSSNIRNQFDLNREQFNNNYVNQNNNVQSMVNNANMQADDSNDRTREARRQMILNTFSSLSEVGKFRYEQSSRKKEDDVRFEAMKQIYSPEVIKAMFKK